MIGHLGMLLLFENLFLIDSILIEEARKKFKSKYKLDTQPCKSSIIQVTGQNKMLYSRRNSKTMLFFRGIDGVN